MRSAYSYQRYSSPEQGNGDSLRRQAAVAEAWCRRNGARLDNSASYRDEGRSGFHGQHRQSGMLRRFLEDVESGRVPRGSVLLIENMDRLSREPPVVGVNVLSSLLLAGIRVVQLTPDELELTADSDLFSLFRGQLSQARGHDESKVKATRMSAVWAEKKRRAREQGVTMTTILPAWVVVKGGKRVLDPARAKVVRLVFQLAIEGWGLMRMVRKLTDDGVPAWGRSQGWARYYLWKVLTGRTVLGEYQPRTQHKPEGPAIVHYYPGVIDEGTWERAQAALARRRSQSGPVNAKTMSLFAGLLWDARTHGKMRVVSQTRGTSGKRRKTRAIVPVCGMEGSGPTTSFQYGIFEQAVLSLLREIDPADVLPKRDESEATTLKAQLAAVRHRLDQLGAQLADDTDQNMPTVLTAVRTLEAKRTALERAVAEASARERYSPATAWGELHSLLDVAERLDETGRLRLRAVLQATIAEVWLLIVPRRGSRVCAVQLHFATGGHRDYVIQHTPAGYRRQGGSWVRSLTSEQYPAIADLDLRRRLDAAALAKVLAGIDLSGKE
jgi:DNA invertase Pin-like site-specific DNA recombinase